MTHKVSISLNLALGIQIIYKKKYGLQKYDQVKMS